MKKTKIDKYHLSLAGEYRVASELLKRGLNATVTFGHAKSADVVAYGSNRMTTVIEVKTSQQKKFVTSFYNKYKTPEHEHPDFWVFVQIQAEHSSVSGKVTQCRNAVYEVKWEISAEQESV